MKKLFLALIALLMFSCIELEKEEFFYERPTLRLAFKSQSDAPIRDISSFTAITYNDVFYALDEYDFLLITKPDSLVILRGVPESQYNVNIVTELAHATLDTLKYIIIQPEVSASHDPIRVGTASYDVKRGKPISPIKTMVLKDLYLNFDVQIVGALDISATNDFVLKMDNVPCVFDFEGGFSHIKLSSILPELVYDRNQDIISANFYSSKFSKTERVTLTLTNKDKVLVIFNISDYLSDASIDMSEDNLEVTIKIYVSSLGNVISINEWEIEDVYDEIDG